MNTIATKPAPWLWRVLRRAYLRRFLRWIETDIEIDTAMLQSLPERIAEHERVAGCLRVEIALLED